MLLRLHSIAYLADGINAYEFVDPDGRDLPPFSAGAHVDLHLKNGLIRQYSLCNDPAERWRYRIGVLNESQGRGGSRYLHEQVRPGDLIELSAPRNNFPLASDADRHVLVAGGIGVTPMIAMIAELQRRGAEFQLYYCTRSPAVTAFSRELAPLVAAGRAVIHHDGGDPARGLDFAAVFGSWRPGTHLYYCGPAGFMSAVKDAVKEWPAASVHYEYFAAPTREEPAQEDRPFRVKLSSSGLEYEVAAGETIVSVLRRNGVPVDTSCEDGYCGTCMTPYVSGEPEHRDDVLDEDSRKLYVLVCCSRSKTPVLELDL